MKRVLLIGAACGLFALSSFAKEVTVYDGVVFYDGYNDKIFDADLNDGVLRHSNSLYSVKLNPADFADASSSDFKMEVEIGALCDNYDRIGNINLALVPKGATSYKPEDTKRIELTRFITPFMDKNKQPDVVPYEYDIPNMARILRDASLNAEYDFWLEFELFGIPYAANEQIRGCAGRNDVFDGTLRFTFTADEESGFSSGNVLVPIYIKTPEHYGNINLNNYNEQATDTLGVTTRTYDFYVPENVTDSRIYLILTNHGANVSGEEYNRRKHLIYVDGEIMLSYVPGGESCEPYRIYNTQVNGIYGNTRPPNYWERNSNWCPGQAVPIREIHTGPLEKGTHSVMIRVPDARFINKDGDFRPSIYFHGVTEGTLEASVDQIWFEGPDVTCILDGTTLRITSDEPVRMLTLHTYDGRSILTRGHLSSKQNLETVDLGELERGMYIATFFTSDGRTTTQKIILEK